MKCKLLLCLLFLWGVVNHSCSSPKMIVLAANGQSNYSIVLPQNYSAIEKKAAVIIQGYFKKVTGVGLSIQTEDVFKGNPAVFIGNTQKKYASQEQRLNGEALAIVTNQLDVFIRGGSGKGIIYAAYTFVDKYLGCKKYDEGPAFCPEQQTLSIPANQTDVQQPAFVYRQSYYPQSADEEYLQWHKLHRFEDLWGLWGHSFFKIIPPSQYFATNPQLFSEVNGKRVPRQLCLSNPTVLSLTVDYLKKAMDKNPDAIYWSIAQNDGGGYCTCPACRKIDNLAGGPQGSVIRFVNQVAAHFPDKQFTTLAYLYSRHPPVNTRVANNVFVMLSTIDAERQKDIENEPSAKGFRNDLSGWAAVTPNLFIWDYTTQFTNYLTPFPSYQDVQTNLAFYKKAGVKGVLMHGSSDGYSDMAELNSYLQAEALWDTKMDVQAVMHNFIQGYYGPAAGYMEEYVKQLNINAHRQGVKMDIYGSPVNSAGDYLSPAALKSYNALFDAAEKAVKGNALFEGRVLRARLPITYVFLQQAKLFVFGSNGFIEQRGEERYVKEDWLKKVQDFVAACKLNNVQQLCEDGCTPDGYLEEWKQAAAVQYKKSLAEDGKIVQLSAYSADYPANGDKTLIDGIFGTVDYSYNWLFIYGNDLNATVELNAVKPVKEVSLHFLNDPQHHILPPTEVKVMVSMDGKTYQQAGSWVYAATSYNGPASIIKTTFNNINRTCKFIKVYAKVAVADAALFDGKKASVCCDELMVY
jgi:hypothetical protein